MHAKRPDGSRVGTAKRAGTRDVLAYTNIFVTNRKFSGGWRSVGDYLVLWDDGRVARIASDKALRVPAYDVIGEAPSEPGTMQIAFPEQAGLPVKGVRKP